MADLASYVRHAERFGTGEVFETACAELDARNLGRLSLPASEHRREVEAARRGQLRAEAVER